MAKFERMIPFYKPNLAYELDESIRNSALSMRLVEEHVIVMHPITVTTRVYDKYFMRNSSRACLTVTIVDNGYTMNVVALAAGGSQGLFLNLSWGAESELVNLVKNSLSKLGV